MGATRHQATIRFERRSLTLLAGALAACLAAACQEPKKPAGRQVSEAWAADADTSTATASPSPPADSRGEGGTPPAAGDEEAIAYVNGKPISRSRVVNLLLAGHGVGILEQLVVLERARQMAAEQGLVITPADIDAELRRSLRNLISPLEAADDDAPFDRDGAERLLDETLARRNISREECMAVVTRNAYLRAIVSANFNFTDEQFGEEYLRSFSPRVEVRHIQLANFAEAERIAQLLAAGQDFTEVARNYSANLRTAPAGGLLRPFSQNDPDVPAALREAAFHLEVGQVSQPVRVDDWYHVLKLERKLPQESKTQEELQPDLEKRLRRRLTEPAMQTLYGTLFEQADIRIEDPVLAQEFARKHPEKKSQVTSDKSIPTTEN